MIISPLKNPTKIRNLRKAGTKKKKTVKKRKFVYDKKKKKLNKAVNNQERQTLNKWTLHCQFMRHCLLMQWITSLL